MNTATIGKILATGLLALEDGLEAFSNPTVETAPAITSFIQGIIGIWKPAPAPAAPTTVSTPRA